MEEARGHENTKALNLHKNYFLQYENQRHANKYLIINGAKTCCVAFLDQTPLSMTFGKRLT
jgi:hypothetical protein